MRKYFNTEKNLVNKIERSSETLEFNLFNLFIRRFIQSSLLLLLLSFISCNKNLDSLEYALQFAGKNRSELEKVLNHYQNDSLKYKAAVFLIKNIPYYYSYKDDPRIDSLKTFKAIASTQKQRVSEELVDKWNSISYVITPKIYDAHVITSDFLIGNIDFSFKIWNTCRWNKYYTFEDFCEYILPYRIKDEPLENWKKLYFNKYKPILDSLYQGTDIIEATRTIANCLKDEGFSNQKDWVLPHLGASYLFKYRLGTCREACDIALYTMRSLGIPITVDEYITSPSYSGKHFWTAIIDTTKKAVPFIYNEKEISRSHFDERDKGKVYRTFFGYQPENIVGIYKDKNVPALFKNPFYKDVSKDYFTNEIEIEIQNDRNEKYVYLSIFRQKRWQPIDIAKADRESTVFFNIEENLIYCPVFYEAGHYVEAGYPF